MGTDIQLEIENTLRDALQHVLGKLPTIARAVEVLAAHIFGLVKDLGLAESRHVDPVNHERPELSTPLRLVVGPFLPVADDDALRDRLYDVFVALAADAQVGRAINGNRPLPRRGVLLLAQTAWNLERTERRAELPLAGGQAMRDGRMQPGDIVDPATRTDFAPMTWTQRSNRSGVPGRTSGDSFRKQTARLAVLVAKYLVDEAPLVPDLVDAQLEVSSYGRRRIIWRDSDAASATSNSRTAQREDSLEPERRAEVSVPVRAAGAPTLVGSPAEVGGAYEHRGFDDEIEHLWTDGGNRRVWLRGGPGLGKSFTARRIMQESLTARGDVRDELLIWVDSADAAAVTRSLAIAAERMLDFGSTVPADAANREDRLARALLERLKTTETRWLVVFDDARAEELIRQQLLPPGTNVNGRALITTLGSPDRDEAGRHVVADLFSYEEAERFLQGRLPDRPDDERAVLAEKLGRHPLVLAMATATIIAERMSIGDWIAEFDTLRLDEVADRPDVGGYAHSLNATWRVALAKAAAGIEDGVVERAAMVAATQDPDGHPTWLWGRDAVTDWVGSGSNSRGTSRRMHPAVRRLVEFGIVELHGDWSDGRIAIHQMAARAVREAADPALLAELAAILAEEWVLRLTSDPETARPEDVNAAIRPLLELPTVDSFTADALRALSGFAEPDLNPTLLHWSQEDIETLEPLLVRGGATGRADLAERRASLGSAEHAHGLYAEARANFTSALEIYAALIADPTLDDESRAESLESMADVEGRLEQLASARDHRQQAVALRERVATSTPDADLSLSNLIALTDLHHAMSNDQRSREMLDRALTVVTERPSQDIDDAADEHRQLAHRLASHGRAAEAIQHMHQAADLSVTTEYGRLVSLHAIQRELARLYAQAGEWKKAERWMKRGGPDVLMLASIQLHRGKTEAARENLARAANERPPASATQSGPQPMPAAIREARESGIDLGLMGLQRKAMGRARWGDAADLAAVRLERVRDRADLSPGEDPGGLAREYRLAGLLAGRAGRHEVAVEWLTSGVRILEMLAQLHPDDETWRALAESLGWLAHGHSEAGEFDQAVVVARRAVGILDGLDIDESPRELGLALYTLADALEGAGDTDGAIAAYTRWVRHLETMVASDSTGGVAIEALANALGNLTRACLLAHRWNDALRAATELLGLRQSLADDRTENVEARAELAAAFSVIAQISANLDRPTESEAQARKAVSLMQTLVLHDPSVTKWQATLAIDLALHAESLSKLDREVEAAHALTEAVNRLQMPAELHPDEYGAIQVVVLRELATVLRGLGRGAEADEMSVRADDLERGFRDPEV